jgi:predicted transcriptional regulator
MTRTLIVTVESDDKFHESVSSALQSLADGNAVESEHTVSFPNEEVLAQTFTAKTLSLLRALSKHKPESIRETARLVERDVKNVHEDLTKLEAMGVIRFEEDGQAKRPVFPFEELVINIPFPHGTEDTETSASP